MTLWWSLIKSERDNSPFNVVSWDLVFLHLNSQQFCGFEAQKIVNFVMALETFRDHWYYLEWSRAENVSMKPQDTWFSSCHAARIDPSVYKYHDMLLMSGAWSLCPELTGTVKARYNSACSDITSSSGTTQRWLGTEIFICVSISHAPIALYLSEGKTEEFIQTKTGIKGEIERGRHK